MVEAGLHVIFDSSQDSPNHDVAEIDIVAVHGLNFKNNPDHALATWKAGDSLWLKDFLPSELTKPARIMLFSYNSSPAMGAAATNLEDHAKVLLHWLNIKRKDSQRPLAFICHSLGGLVVKEALIEATLDVTCKSIVESTRLLVFFATPHRGGNYSSIGDAVAKIVRVSLRNPNNNIVNALKKSSQSATRRFDQSRNLYERCLVVNFYEGESYGKLGIIVDKNSATLGLPGSREKQVSTQANHSSICKFSSIKIPACELVLQTIVNEVERALGIEPRNVHWLVERPTNPLFTGRRDLIHRIKSAVTSPSPRDQRRFVLTGMGGQGKSEVCLKIANELREEFWGVFWVDVSSDTTAKAGFSTIAKMLGSNETEIDEARRLLSNIDPKHSWLLILDNADNPDFDYQQYCPSGSRGTVLITSRNNQCQSYKTVGYEVLGNLDELDCVHLLLRAAKLDPQSPNAKDDAKKVIKILGFHTLAILQAGAYIAMGACDLHEYPSLFQQKSERLLRFNLNQSQSRYHNVYATLEAAAEFLETRQSEHAQDPLCLLQALSPMHYENVPLDLFQYAWEGAQFAKPPAENDAVEALTSEHVSKLPDFVEPHSPSWDSFRMWKAVDLLESLALIRRSKIGGCWTISMHPLTHKWINLRQSLTQKHESLRGGECTIALSCNFQPGWQPHQTHLGIHLLTLLEQSSLAEENLRGYLLPIYIMFGWLLDDLRYDQKQEEHLRHIFNEMRIEPSSPSDKFLNLFSLSASHAYNWGDIKRSLDILKGVVQIQETTLEETDPDRLASLHELASAYLANGQTKEAINIFQKIVLIQNDILEETHPSRLASLHELASAYLANGQTKEAINIFQQIILIENNIVEETHPDQLASRHELARAYLANGQTKEAINIFQQIILIQNNILEETHPDQLASRHELARAYLANGQTKEAINLLEHVVRIQETTLDETHPNRLGAQRQLADARLSYNRITNPEPSSTPSTSVDKRVPWERKRRKMKDVLVSRLRHMHIRDRR